MHTFHICFLCQTACVAQPHVVMRKCYLFGLVRFPNSLDSQEGRRTWLVWFGLAKMRRAEPELHPASSPLWTLGCGSFQIVCAVCQCLCQTKPCPIAWIILSLALLNQTNLVQSYKQRSMACAPVTLNQTKPSYISAINADCAGSQGPVAIKNTWFFRLSTHLPTQPGRHHSKHYSDGRRSWGRTGGCDNAEKGRHSASLRSA